VEAILVDGGKNLFGELEGNVDADGLALVVRADDANMEPLVIAGSGLSAGSEWCKEQDSRRGDTEGPQILEEMTDHWKSLPNVCPNMCPLGPRTGQL